MHTCACMPRLAPVDKHTLTAAATVSLDQRSTLQASALPCYTGARLSTCHCPSQTHVYGQASHIAFSPPRVAPSCPARHLRIPHQSMTMPLMHVHALPEGSWLICNRKTLCRTSLTSDAPPASVAALTPSLFRVLLRHEPALGSPIVNQGLLAPLPHALLQKCCWRSLCHSRDFQQCSRYGTGPHWPLLSQRLASIDRRAASCGRQAVVAVSKRAEP